MLLHVTRDHLGRRRLDEIATLRQADSGRVQVVTAWRADYGMTDGGAELWALLNSRLPA